MNSFQNGNNSKDSNIVDMNKNLHDITSKNEDEIKLKQLLNIIISKEFQTTGGCKVKVNLEDFDEFLHKKMKIADISIMTITKKIEQYKILTILTRIFEAFLIIFTGYLITILANLLVGTRLLGVLPFHPIVSAIVFFCITLSIGIFSILQRDTKMLLDAGIDSTGELIDKISKIKELIAIKFIDESNVNMFFKCSKLNFSGRYSEEAIAFSEQITAKMPNFSSAFKELNIQIIQLKDEWNDSETIYKYHNENEVLIDGYYKDREIENNDGTYGKYVLSVTLPEKFRTNMENA